MNDLTPRRTTLPSGNATFLEAGSEHAPIVLLLHGGGLDCAALSWRCLVPELARRHHVIAPNWPGYAGTTPFGRPYTITDIGLWLMEFLDHVGVERAVVVGISMGGGAALWSAVNRPERLAALVPVGTYGVAERARYHTLTYLLTKLPLNAVSYGLMRRYPWMLRRAVEAIFADPGKVTPEILAEVEDVLATAGNGEAFTNFQRGETTATGLRSVFGSDLQGVSQPTLFIHGKNDALVPLGAVEVAANAMPNARLEVMPAGHWPMREDPETFNSLVLSFLKDPDRHT